MGCPDRQSLVVMGRRKVSIWHSRRLLCKREGLGMQKVVNISPRTQLLWILEAGEQWDRGEQLCP